MFITVSSLIFPLLVVYGCETRSITLRKEHKLQVLENIVLKKIFRPQITKTLMIRIG
jgi:hypothetical protein